MYIPLDKEHIYEGTKRIFTFLSQIGVNHASKISKMTRFDDIVIRVESIEATNQIKIL